MDSVILSTFHPVHALENQGEIKSVKPHKTSLLFGPLLQSELAQWLRNKLSVGIVGMVVYRNREVKNR